MTFVASLLLSVLPQVFPGNDLKLPPRKDVPAAVPAARPLSEIERFRRDLMEMQGPEQKVEARLQDMAAAYAPPVMESLILEVARSARANEMTSLMTVVRRFGTGSAKVADELLFQLLSRPLAEATRPVVETMVSLKGADAKPALQECLRSRIAGVRRHAAEAMVPLLTVDDLPFALQLSREQSLDLQMRGIDLLRALPHEGSAQRLTELLSKDPSLAGAACAGLIGQRQSAVGPLQQVLSAPAIDRGQAYAAFALAQIAKDTTPEVLPDAAGPALAQRLTDPELLTRSLVAVPLADLLFRSAPGMPAIDASVVEALLDVVQPLQFVPNLDLLRRPAEERLQRTTGRIMTLGAGPVLPWRTWWKDQKEGFAAVRAKIAVDKTSVASAVVTLRQEQRHVRLLAEGLADVPPVADATEVVLTADQMEELLTALHAGGFTDEAAMRVDSALPRVRSLQVRVPAGRAQVAMPLASHPRFDALVALVLARLDEEAWQLYRNPKDEPDRGAFWRAERRWRDANPGALERGRRFLRRAVAGWTTLSPTLRARAIDQVLAHPDRKQLLAEEDGERALAMLASLPELNELDLRLLELAASVPGDRCWRVAVDLAARAKGGGRTAVRAVFAVLPPDAVLQALHDDNPLVRRSGIDEIMVVRDQRAAGRLVELLSDTDPEVRRTAAAACGHLQIAAAARPLIDAIVAADTTPALRQECLRSLGRVGGDLAFPVLQRALTAKSQDDKEAAMRGLGELRDPRAAHVLADLVVVGHGKDLGALARLYLQRQSGTFAIEALRGQLDLVKDPAIRDDLVLLLGGYHDASVVPNLLDLLRSPRLAAQAAPLLEGTTGLSFSDARERGDLAEAWYRKHKNEPQWQWLLDALKAADVATALRPEHFSAADPQAPIAELARLLVEVDQPRLWALAGAVLRTVAREDYGAVSLQTPLPAREAIAARYRLLVESSRSAGR